MTEPIPGPPGLPLLGNINDIDPADSMADLCRLADTYGPIFKLNLGGSDRVFISTRELLNEVCDDQRFTKMVSGPLEEIRNGVHDGLFTAYPGEHNWEIAHRVLMPAFGPLSIRSMFDEMHDIASQLVVKWARFGPKERINVPEDFTRLTLDSIAICAMGTRFNSFYHEGMHPFVDAMVGLLRESAARARRPAVANYLHRSAQLKYDADISLLKKVAAEVVAERRTVPSDKKDLLNAMINGRDPKTGEGLTEESILNNMITFLIAGHETTSGLLSFLFYYLLKNPAAYQTAQRQVDEVVGRGPITVDHMSNLPYIEACLRETLRLRPTAPAFTLQPLPDSPDEYVSLGGKYQIRKGQTIVALLPAIHRDPAVFGSDAEAFRPERMLDEPFSKLPNNSWKPFGHGMRGCIGRPFAWQEAVLTTAMLLQTFDFRQDDPSYTLQIKQTLTIKPKDFFMHASLREHIDPVHLEKMLHVDTSNEGKGQDKAQNIDTATASKSKKPMTILYGSNAGTCEALAQSLARVASGRGYHAQVDPLDSAVDKVPKDQPVILISSSYEGQPPDNAAHFCEWLQNLDGPSLKGVKYAVFGCGNHDWVSTFHQVPKLLNSGFEGHGATQIAKMGLGDVAAGDIFNDFDRWQDEQLWSALGGDAETEEEVGLEIDIDTGSRRSKLRQDVKEAVVMSNELLTKDGEPEKRHIVLNLPTGVTYKTGDYLAVLPMNNPKNVRRVLKWAHLPWDTMVTIKDGANTTLPTGHPISMMDILGMYVELSQPATRKNIARIAASCSDEGIRLKISALAGKNFEQEILNKRRSPLDILEDYPAAALPLSDFLAMLPPMRIRQYSISSSPLPDPTTATITWSVLDTPSKSAGSKRFLGVASNYLSSVEEGDRIHVAVKPSHSNFHPPADIENTPVIMFCAGTGLAPFRGFVQERAMQVQAGRKLAPAYLFIGCAHPEKDTLFSNEFSQWEKDGVVKLFYAFSKSSSQSKGCRYVQDRLWEEREEMVKVFNEGASLYVCGSGMVGEGVASTTKRIYQEAAEALGKPKTDDEVEAWFAEIKSDRYASDVFA
ncbi:putative cytochrome P450 oxidoreductase OrdA-like protein [Leptodontidium sp. 2 PMI_412]|nr:putative cytochrome P450 oxidoreductase OrdA-like protein [Leptodontidium sp. 2 PMI_412]